MTSQSSNLKTDEDEELERIQSLDSLAERQNRTESKLDEILAMLTRGGRSRHGDTSRGEAGDGDTETGRPSSIAEQVRAELARARREDKRAAEKAKQQSEIESLRERQNKLEEKPPKPPQPRRQRWMWGQE